MADVPRTEPTPTADLEPFEEGDLFALSERCSGDPQYNDRRLLARRKLLALGKALLPRAKKAGVTLDARSSLHHPHAFNGNRVRRLWVYVCRAKAEKTRLKRVIGPELGKDLDSAFRNAYLCVALEGEALEVSLRIHADAWYDGQNLVNRVKAEGAEAWLAVLNELEGYRIQLADWKGEWVCGRLDGDSIGELLRYYTPGEHALSIERRTPLPAASPELREAAFAEDLPGHLLEELERLLPAYRHAAWSKESDHLFAG